LWAVRAPIKLVGLVGLFIPRLLKLPPLIQGCLAGFTAKIDSPFSSITVGNMAL
jgi:hypothetical protein